MLEVLGRGYVIEHCISSFAKRQKEKVYKMYVTDALHAIVNNMSNNAGKLVLAERYIDIIEPKPKNEKSADEVVSSIRKKMGGG